MRKDMQAKRIFYDWAWCRVKHLWSWKGQVICRLFGHELPKNASCPKCGRCGMALEEIYGLDFYNYFTPTPHKEIEIEQFRAENKQLADDFNYAHEKKKELQAEKNHWRELEGDLMAQVSSKDVLYRNQLRTNRQLQDELKKHQEKLHADTLYIIKQNDKVEQLKAELAEYRWIPVSELLPEERKEIEFCVVQNRNSRFIDLGHYTIEPDGLHNFFGNQGQYATTVISHYRYTILPEQALKDAGQEGGK